jgi:phage-related protein
MTIGLHGDYDIDQVIEYFNQSGNIIFSNELDKFYVFDQIAKIDFERLARFKTATVNFHVQPFKKSAVDDYFVVSTDLMHIRLSDQTNGGVRVVSSGNKISVSGTANADAEFYVPITNINAEAGSYTLYGQTSGDGDDSCKIRLINELPTDADSFGNTEIQLGNDVEVSDTLAEDKTYKYVWMKMTNGTQYDFELSLQFIDENVSSTKVLNRGNIYSRPKLTIYGEGAITISVNGTLLFTITMGNNGWIVIDGEKMEAYKGDVLKNRSVAGDYSRLKLECGSNTISWSGDLRQIDVENVSRWI